MEIKVDLFWIKTSSIKFDPIETADDGEVLFKDLPQKYEAPTGRHNTGLITMTGTSCPWQILNPENAVAKFAASFQGLSFNEKKIQHIFGLQLFPELTWINSMI